MSAMTTIDPTLASLPARRWSKDLARSAVQGYRFMDQFCRMRTKFIAEFLGSNYGGALQGAPVSGRRPFNVLQQGCGVVLPNMVARNPGVEVESKTAALKGSATIMKMLADHANERDKHVDVLRSLVNDALFTCGISYTAIMEDGYGVSGDDGRFHPTGKVRTEPIPLDDFAMDPTVKHFDQSNWKCHRLSLPRQFALDRGLYSPDFIEKCPSYEELSRNNLRTDEMLTAGIDRAEADAVDEHIYLTQFHLRREGMIITLPGVRDMNEFAGGGDLYDEKPYYGPEEGCPYNMLGYTYAPHMPMPVAPVGIWLDMHLALNVLARKLVDQVKAMKSVVAGDMGAEDDLQALIDAENTGVLRLRNAERIKNLNWGGPADSSLQIFQFFMALSNVIQGNNNLTGGLQANAKTATEAELLSAGANVRLTDMQEITYGFATELQKLRMWYIFNDPYLQETLSRELAPGVSIQMPVDHSMLEGDFLQYNFRITMESMQRVDPMVQTKRRLDHAQVVMLAAQLEQATGGRFNAEFFIRKCGQGIYMPGELDQLWRTPEAAMRALVVMGMFQPGGGMGGPGEGMGMQKPGLPGQPGMAGRMDTGKGSANFDIGANTQASRAASAPSGSV